MAGVEITPTLGGAELMPVINIRNNKRNIPEEMLLVGLHIYEKLPFCPYHPNALDAITVDACQASGLPATLLPNLT